MPRLRMLPLTPAQQQGDIALGAAVLVGTIISTALSAVSGVYDGVFTGDARLAIAYAFVLAVPIAFRRRWPATVAVVVSVAYFTAVTLQIPEVWAGNIAVFIALYTLGAWSPHRRRALVVRVGIIVGMFGWLFVSMFQGATAPDTGDGLSRAGAFSPYLASLLMSLLINVLFFAGAYYFGDRTWAAAEQRRELEGRTAELEREREITAAQAVALDRVRIARELHDIVAHHVSVMGVRAGAARAVMEKNPDAARATLAEVEDSARTALTELRQLLQTLRTPGEEGAPPTTPALTLDALPRLAAEAEGAGLATTVTIVGEPSPVPALVQANLARIAQEALTNARRHAGPDATADVRLRYLASAVELEVANTGRVVAHATPGLGQRGMHERAAAIGGAIHLGPRSRGGYLVRVTVPLPAETAQPATAREAQDA